jgi:hypothetical protein
MVSAQGAGLVGSVFSLYFPIFLHWSWSHFCSAFHSKTFKLVQQHTLMTRPRWAAEDFRFWQFSFPWDFISGGRMTDFPCPRDAVFSRWWLSRARVSFSGRRSHLHVSFRGGEYWRQSGLWRTSEEWSGEQNEYYSLLTLVHHSFHAKVFEACPSLRTRACSQEDDSIHHSAGAHSLAAILPSNQHASFRSTVMRPPS